MKNILIIGQKSFIAKNFINDFNDKFNFYYFTKYFRKKNNNFSTALETLIKKYKINLILNFAADNDNSLANQNFDKVLESNFYLPLLLIRLTNKFKMPLFLFLSKDMDKNNIVKNFYSLSKEMLKVYLDNKKFKCKLRILNIDSVYGPFDINYKRIFPSIFYNIYNKKKYKTNLNQLKNFTYVKDLNKIIFKLIFKKKKFIYKNIRSEKINIKLASSLLKKNKNFNLKNKKSKYHSLFLTSEWYKNYYEKK